MLRARNPVTIEYLFLLIYGILFEFLFLVWVVTTWPEWRIVFLSVLPPILTISYCIFSSSFTQSDIVSPIFLMILNPLVGIFALAIYNVSYPSASFTLNVETVVMANVLWIFLSVYFHNFVVAILGAYGDAETITDNMISYEVFLRPEDIVFCLNKQWLSLNCGLEIRENKSGNGEVKLRLRRLGSNLYIAVYGAREGNVGRTALNVIPYALVDNFRCRNIDSNPEITRFLLPQIEELEKKLGAIRVGRDIHESEVRRPETVHYVLSPTRYARTGRLREHKIELAIVAIASAVLMILTSLRVENSISDALFVGFVGVTITASLGLIGLLLRRR